MITSWLNRYKLVRAYADANGEPPTTKYKTEDGISLGSWINEQRKKRARLSAEQKERLESIKGWRWRVRTTQRPIPSEQAAEWKRKRDLVRDYVAANGCLPKQKYKAEDGTALGTWINHQRQNYMTLSAERRASLESITGWRWQNCAIHWSAPADRAAEWKRKCDLVRGYVEANGRLPQQNHEEKEVLALGQWISRQRQNREKLTAEQRASLESIVGWRWRVRFARKPTPSDEDAEWARECAQLRECSAAKRRKQDE